MPSLADLKFSKTISTNQLASDAITSVSAGEIDTRILNSTLDLSGKTLNLPSGIFGPAQQPSGSVIAAYATTSNTEYDLADFGNRVYRDLPGFEITFTTKLANSKIWMVTNTTWYQDNYSGGINIRFSFNGTGLFQSNDEWQGIWHGSSANANSSKVTCSAVHEPGLAAGTSCTVRVQGGQWSGGSASDVRVNYAGYGIRNGLAVFEIK